MILSEIARKDYKIFLDLDGVFADFVKGVEKITGEPHDEEQYEADEEYQERMWKAIKKHRKEGGELWYSLDLLPDAMELWNHVKKRNPTFLSATGTTDANHTADQKKRWVKEKFGDVPIITKKMAKLKQEEAGKNHILIDDKEKALKPWREAGGIGILHTSAANTIKELKKLGL